MGLYDEVRVPCPHCGEVYYAQSKGGDCAMRTYDLCEAPADVLSDLNRGSIYYTCNGCGETFTVEITTTAAVRRA